MSPRSLGPIDGLAPVEKTENSNHLDCWQISYWLAESTTSIPHSSVASQNDDHQLSTDDETFSNIY